MIIACLLLERDSKNNWLTDESWTFLTDVQHDSLSLLKWKNDKLVSDVGIDKKSAPGADPDSFAFRLAVFRRLSGPTQKTLLVGPLECGILKGLHDKVFRGASQRQHSGGQIQQDFYLVLAPIGVNDANHDGKWWRSQLTTLRAFWSFLLDIDYGDAALSLACTCSVLNFLPFLYLQIYFHICPRTRKREIKKTKTLSVLVVLGVIVHTKMSLLGEGYLYTVCFFYTLKSPLITLSEVQLCIPNSTLLFKRITKVWPFPHSHWFRGQEK